MTPDILDRFTALVGAGQALSAPGDIEPFVLEHRDLYRGVTPMVLRPGTVAEVSAIMKLAHETGTPIVPQGGNTGLVGGQIPHGGEIVLSLSRLNAIRALDPDGDTITVEAGCILDQVHRAAEAAGRLFPLSLGSEGSCQIGGNLSTNAGGTAVLAYGNARELVLGLEVVLADGRVWNGLRALRKDNTGYSLKDLFIGAEGTLGIVTRAVLRLVEAEPFRAVALLVVPDVAAARVVLNRLERLPGLSALEAMWPDYWSYARRATGIDPLSAEPSGRQVVLLAELRGWADDALRDALLEAAGRLMEVGLVLDAALAASEAQAERFWRLREANAELYRHFPHLLGFDLSIDPGRMEDLIAGVAASLAAPQEALWFGHMGDANLHLAVTGVDAAAAKDVKRCVYDAVRDLEGSVSAEHGIGAEKLDWLGHTRTAAEIALMRSLRTLLDPNGIMNPGRTVPPAA